MKFYHTLLIPFVCLLLSACENPMRFKTVVHEDSSLDKIITFEKAKKHLATHNVFGIDSTKGWSVEVTRVKSESDSLDIKYNIAFSKHFSSAEAVNQELDQPVDTLFQINTQVEKKFKWFYTYMTYRETYRPLNRFRDITPDDYFNQEDHAFLNRLPGEGTAISKADSLYLEMLNLKISERFVNMAIFHESNAIIKDIIINHNLDKKWLDTLSRKQQKVYKIIEDGTGEDNIIESIVDQLGIPLQHDQAVQDFKRAIEEFNSRTSFMSFANDGKYVNEVEMPWEIISTNADSVAGRVAVWKPLPVKFAFKEYTMYAESRKMNLWAIAASLVIIGITVFLFIRKAGK